MEREEAEYWAHAILSGEGVPGESCSLSNESAMIVSEYSDVMHELLSILPESMAAFNDIFSIGRVEESLPAEMRWAHWSAVRSAIRELLQEDTAPCPVCKSEQEYTDYGYEQPDMDGSSFWVPGGLACGHAEPSHCENGFSTGPLHDPYGVYCHLDMALHTRVKGGWIHEGRNPLAAPGEEIILWTGGGYCAGDPLPVRIIGYKPESRREPSWLENLAR